MPQTKKKALSLYFKISISRLGAACVLIIPGVQLVDFPPEFLHGPFVIAFILDLIFNSFFFFCHFLLGVSHHLVELFYFILPLNPIGTDYPMHWIFYILNSPL